MTHSAIRNLVRVTLASAFLAGCEEGALAPTDKPAETQSVGMGIGAAAPKASRTTAGGDVEAPEVFSTTDQALWDGRPSLGGIWVAAPDAVNPERVIMRNTENGKSVTGALFRRERENPGPALQISSDAAAALGLLAGQPGTVSVVALRKNEPAPEPETAAEPAAAAEPTTEPASATETPVAAATDLSAVAGAAIDEAEGVAPAAVATTDTSGTTEPTEGTEAVAPDTPAAEQPAKKGFLAGLFKPKTPKADAGAPLSAIDPAAAVSAPGESALTEAPAAAEPTAAPAAVETATIADPAPAATNESHQYAIGAFSVEENAKGAAKTLEKAGLTALIQPGKTGDKPIWAVYATGPGDKSALLDKIKGLGFKDAYLVK